ncbi:hypothetical protein DSO57_1017437 [Entomophthora muscae]|uniref:Uncharacterized protein n=1 Tax=Entomophthora muscae TaxID=34485 RepID=A0ACC2UE53_9FUNG|nr:hypothetical protein DSO57_1017437 [Entomophthora muscae]
MLLHFKKCSKAPAPIQRDSLNQDKDPNIFPFVQLVSNLKIFQRNEIWTEAYLAFRVYCLNFNQHRQTVHFRNFTRLIQILKRFQGLDLESYTQQLLDQFYFQSKNDKKSSWTHLPDPEYTKHALLKYTGVFHLCSLCMEAAGEIYSSVMFLLSKYDFMHTSAVILGMASRIKLIAELWKDSATNIVYLLRNMNDLYKKPIDIPTSWDILEPSKHKTTRGKVAMEDFKAAGAYSGLSIRAKSKKRSLRKTN